MYRITIELNEVWVGDGRYLSTMTQSHIDDVIRHSVDDSQSSSAMIADMRDDLGDSEMFIKVPESQKALTERLQDYFAGVSTCIERVEGMAFKRGDVRFKEKPAE